eukprot:COSAG01_NODE_5169_length_4435_cov_4.063624_2_plen_62_part_00
MQCVDIEFESSTPEPFYHLQLQVRGCADLHAAFANFVAVEELDGANRYRAQVSQIIVAPLR